MKLNRQTLGNIAVVMVAVLLFGAFVALGTRGGHKKNVLAGLATTSTTHRSTTTTEPETTTSELIATTTSAPPVSTTLATPATTAASHTTTTKATTGTTRPSGQQTETMDNTASIAHSQSSCVLSSTAPPSNSGALTFSVDFGTQADAHTRERGAHGCSASGDTASVPFIISLTNNTNKSISFPNQTVDVVITLTGPSGATTLHATASGDNGAPLLPGQTITLFQTNSVSGYGTFSVGASCVVDYG